MTSSWSPGTSAILANNPEPAPEMVDGPISKRGSHSLTPRGSPPPSMSSLLSSPAVDFPPWDFGFPAETDFLRPELSARCPNLGKLMWPWDSPPGLFGSHTNAGLVASGQSDPLRAGTTFYPC